MSAQSLPYSQPVTEPTPLIVSFRVLLGLYAIIPLCLLLQWSDSLFWDGFLKNHLPANPTHFFLFQLLFGTPHILASTLILTSNSEYFQLYKSKIVLMTLLIMLVFGIGSLWLPYKALYVISVAWTVFHVLKQQHGITRGIFKLPEWAFNSMLALSVLTGIAIYLGIFLRTSFSPEHTLILQTFCVYACAGLIVLSLVCQRYVNDTFGKTFLWGNSFLVLSSFYLYMQHYYFLAILVPRLVHDATAYIFYVTHDYNRHHQQPQNALYTWAKRCNLHVFLVLPGLSFGLAFLLQNFGDGLISSLTQALFGTELQKAVTLGLIGYFSLMHYYTEAFTWKFGSPYRRFISFKK